MQRSVRPLRRSLRMVKGLSPNQGTILETYDEFGWDADIPDEKFKLPEEKK